MMLVTCAIVVKDGKILITQRPLHKHQGGKWEFPGGKVQDDEVAENCIRREIKEELDLDISIKASLSPVHHRYADFELELQPFVCRIEKGQLHLHEHIAHEWLDVDQLESFDLCAADRKLMVLHKQAIRELLLV